MPEIDFDAEAAPDAYDALCQSEPELAGRLKLRATLGGILLDAARPGWERAIRLDALDQATLDRDVLAQAFGSRGRGRDELTKTLRSGRICDLPTFGVKLAEHEATYCDNPECPNGCPSRSQVEARYAALTALWVRAARSRLAAGRGEVAGA